MRPLSVDLASVRVDLVVMSAFTLVMGWMVLTGLRVSRREGAVLLLAYAVYVGFLFT